MCLATVLIIPEIKRVENKEEGPGKRTERTTRWKREILSLKIHSTEVNPIASSQIALREIESLSMEFDLCQN